jgi:filamentous hemagglutinin
MTGWEAAPRLGFGSLAAENASDLLVAAESGVANIPSVLSRSDLGAEIGSGAEKTVYSLNGNSNVVVAVQNNGNQALITQEIGALNQLGDMGLPVVKNYGMVTVDGNPAIALENIPGASSRDIYIEGATGVPGDGFATGNAGATSLLNSQSISDLQSIRAGLVNNDVGVTDLQFLIGTDGRVVINDPMAVTNSVKPSNLQLIDNLIGIAKGNQP